MQLCLFDEARRRDPDPAAGVRRRRLARLRAGRRPRAGLRLPGDRAVRPGPRAALQPGQAAARPVRPGDQRRGPVRAGGARLRRRPTRTRRARWTRPAHVPRSLVVDPAFGWQDRARPAAPRTRTRSSTRSTSRASPCATRTSRRSCAAPTPGWPRGRASPTCSTSASPRSSCCRCTRTCPRRSCSQRGLTNYWGYNTIGYFAPHAGYSAAVRAGQPGGPGRRVQGDGRRPARRRPRGPARRGVQPHRRGRPRSARRCASAAWTTPPTTGSTPPTPAATSTRPAAATRSTPADPIALQLIMDSLRYWLTEMHVDGFRFDLAPTLARQDGRLRPAVRRSSTWCPRTRWSRGPS